MSIHIVDIFQRLKLSGFVYGLDTEFGRMRSRIILGLRLEKLEE
jgi:hypothetical protein